MHYGMARGIGNRRCAVALFVFVGIVAGLMLGIVLRLVGSPATRQFRAARLWLLMRVARGRFLLGWRGVLGRGHGARAPEERQVPEVVTRTLSEDETPRIGNPRTARGAIAVADLLAGADA